MRTGSLLCLQSAEGMEPLGAFNQPVYRSYSQLRAALLNDLGTPFADYFARPDFDADAARIGWVAHELGEPRRWIDLSPEEHARLDPVRQKLQDGFAAYRQQLEAAPENSTRGNFGKLLAQALRVPGMQYLYVLGDQPVVAFWGFRTASTGSAVDPLMVAAGSVTLGGGGAAAAAETATAATSTVVRRRRGWWWWLLALLLLLLLLALLWWWFVGSYDRNGFVIQPPLRPQIVTPPDQTSPNPVVPGPNPGLNTNPPFHDQTPVPPDHSDVVPPVHDGTVPVVPPNGETDQHNHQNNDGNGFVPCSGPTPCGPGNLPVPGDDKNSDKTAPSDRIPGPQDNQPPANPEVTPNKGLPNNGLPNDGANGVPDKVPDNLPALPPVQPPGQSPKHGPDLAVPPNAPPGPAGFMQGTWRSQSGLKLNGRPAEEYYQFNKDGKGRVVVRSRDGRQECSGPAQATIGPDHHLHVQEAPNISCNDGGTIPGAATTCSPQQSGAVCEGQNEDGSHFSVRMEQAPK
jgi:hypothetical protein